ncbi:MAG: hypothetical protein ACLGH3_00500 [Actinomycetota bacterium]
MNPTRRRAAAALAAAGLTLPLILSAPSGAASPWVLLNEGRNLTGSGAFDSEPGLDFLPDGTLYVHGTSGAPLHNPLWRLDPGDSRFKAIQFTTPYNRLPGGGDADIAIRGDDVFFIDLWLGSNSIQYSPDKGATWTRGTPLTTLPLSDRQWIALGPEVSNPVTGETQNTVYAIYQFVQPGLGMWLARSEDNGLTWTYHTGVAGLNGTTAIPGHIATDGNKHLVIGGINGGKQWVIQSFDGGETFTRVSAHRSYQMVADDIGPQMTAVTMNPSKTDELAVAFVGKYHPQDASVGRFELFVSNTRSGGTDDSIGSNADNGGFDFRRVSKPGYTTYFPWIDYRDDKIAVAWYQASKPGNFDPNTPPPGNTWEVWYAESLDDGRTWSAPEQVTAAGAVKVGPICTKGLSCTADRDLGDFLQIAIDPTDGKAAISYVNANGTNGARGIYVAKQG